METLPEVYSLTSLQIGDIQSYLSRVFLYFAPVSKKLFILVDNHPWSVNKHSRSRQIWQLMVNKYRMSPFINTRTLIKVPEQENKTKNNDHLNFNHEKRKKFCRWSSVISAAKLQKKSLLSVMDLTRALHGFIVFELAWKDVHGINYVNELQTDTSLALEVNLMKKWEFNSSNQAKSSVSSWFSGTLSETLSLKGTLEKLSELEISHWNYSTSNKLFPQNTTELEAFSVDQFYDSEQSPFSADDHLTSEGYDIEHSSLPTMANHKKEEHMKCLEMEESDIVPTPYRDTLLLLRFSDSVLPFKLRQIITSDLRLLRLLESGLPSWVIFFQSYPLFCQFYRPWMRALVRTLYILISLVTVIIGFYDLYKNVPLLKSTVAHLCGPLFDWIEAWDMVSRIRYLGTMLFLQNFEKGIKWFMKMAHATRPLWIVIIKPLEEPLAEVVEFISPVSNICFETGELFCSTFCFAVESSYTGFLDLIEVLLWPFELIYLCIWDTAISIYHALCSFWELFNAPIQYALTLANYAAYILSDVYIWFKDIWESTRSMIQLASFSEATKGTYDISIWRNLQNDLFPQVFRAVRSIIKGFSAFFMTCNRHRLSIYNYMREFFWSFACFLSLIADKWPHKRTPQQHNMDHREGDRRK